MFQIHGPLYLIKTKALNNKKWDLTKKLGSWPTTWKTSTFGTLTDLYNNQLFGSWQANMGFHQSILYIYIRTPNEPHRNRSGTAGPSKRTFKPISSGILWFRMPHATQPKHCCRSASMSEGLRPEDCWWQRRSHCKKIQWLTLQDTCPLFLNVLLCA